MKRIKPTVLEASKGRRKVVVIRSFGFAEGAEDIKGFWHQGGRYFVENTGVANPFLPFKGYRPSEPDRQTRPVERRNDER